MSTTQSARRRLQDPANPRGPVRETADASPLQNRVKGKHLTKRLPNERSPIQTRLQIDLVVLLLTSANAQVAEARKDPRPNIPHKLSESAGTCTPLRLAFASAFAFAPTAIHLVTHCLKSRSRSSSLLRASKAVCSLRAVSCPLFFSSGFLSFVKYTLTFTSIPDVASTPDRLFLSPIHPKPPRRSSHAACKFGPAVLQPVEPATTALVIRSATPSSRRRIHSGARRNERGRQGVAASRGWTPRRQRTRPAPPLQMPPLR